MEYRMNGCLVCQLTEILLRYHGHEQEIDTETLKQVLGPSIYDEGVIDIVQSAARNNEGK